MKRFYQYRSHTIDVSVAAQGPAYPTQGNPTATPDYIAVLTIYSEESGAVPKLGPLRIERTTERVFASEAEALMGGFSEARRIIDMQIESDERNVQDPA